MTKKALPKTTYTKQDLNSMTKATGEHGIGKFGTAKFGTVTGHKASNKEALVNKITQV